MSPRRRPRPVAGRVGSVLLPVVLAAALAACTGGDPTAAPAPSTSQGPAGPAEPSPEAVPVCLREPRTDRDGLTPADSVLCLGVVARVAFRADSGGEAVPVEVRVTAVRGSSDADFDPGVPGLGGLPVWLVDYEVRPARRLDVAAWNLDAPTATLTDGSGERTRARGPADCKRLGAVVPVGRWTPGCAWVVGGPDAVPTGAELATRFAPQDPFAERTVSWALDAAGSAPA